MVLYRVGGVTSYSQIEVPVSPPKIPRVRNVCLTTRYLEKRRWLLDGLDYDMLERHQGDGFSWE
jgi:hypothetical protein